MISPRSIIIHTLLLLSCYQILSQQKLEFSGPSNSLNHQDLHLNEEAYQKLSRYDKTNHKPDHQPLAHQLHSFSLDRAIWKNDLEKIFDLDGNLIGVKGVIKGVRDLKSSESKVLSHIGHLKDLYGIKNVSDEIHIMSTELDHNGHTHTRVEQYVDGISVYGGDMILHENEDHEIYLIQGSPVQMDKNLSATPKLSTKSSHHSDGIQMIFRLL